MSIQRTTTHTVHSVSLVEKQLRDMGIVIMQCDDKGNIKTKSNTDWLVDLLAASPLLQRSISTNCETWNAQDVPVVCEAFSGVWLAPVRQSSSRRNNGFSIGVIITEAFCDGEYFHALCQASNADATVIRELIQSLSPVATHDIQRVSLLFQIAWNSQMQSDVQQRPSCEK